MHAATSTAQASENLEDQVDGFVRLPAAVRQTHGYLWQVQLDLTGTGLDQLRDLQAEQLYDGWPGAATRLRRLQLRRDFGRTGQRHLEEFRRQRALAAKRLGDTQPMWGADAANDLVRASAIPCRGVRRRTHTRQSAREVQDERVRGGLTACIDVQAQAALLVDGERRDCAQELLGRRPGELAAEVARKRSLEMVFGRPAADDRRAQHRMHGSGEFAGRVGLDDTERYIMAAPVTRLHPLLSESIRNAIERAASAHLGRPWTASSFTDLNDQASHPCGVFHGESSLSIFAKLGDAADAGEQFAFELRGLEFVRQRAGVSTPTPIGEGLVELEHSWLLLFEALPERLPEVRTVDDWRAIGQTLAALHQVQAEHFGLEHFDGFFGPLRQDNRPVASDRWAEFYAERRIQPRLRSAVDAGHLPTELAANVERLLQRLPSLCGPEPRPTLLHGDAQQHNFVSTNAGACVIDVAPYFGHPELDLALVDYFDAVPADVFRAYQEIVPVDAGFGERRNLWRIFGYLAVVTVDGDTPFGWRMLARLADAVRSYT